VTLLAPAPIGTELLDDPAADAARVRESLGNIARANWWFGGVAAVRLGLARALEGVPAGSAFTLLDVGTGAGDLPRAAVAWAAARGIRIDALGIERHPAAARLARRNGLATLLADGGALPLADRSVDLVLLSQVAHHFTEADIVRLFRECGRVARRAVIVADLRRSRLAALGWPLAGWVFRFDQDTVRDGVVSLERGFSTASLERLLVRAGMPAPVRRCRGVRLVAVWRRPA
jgi:SAM-dependent methyltransferase